MFILPHKASISVGYDAFFRTTAPNPKHVPKVGECCELKAASIRSTTDNLALKLFFTFKTYFNTLVPSVY